jgi:hypothetical protein
MGVLTGWIFLFFLRLVVLTINASCAVKMLIAALNSKADERDREREREGERKKERKKEREREKKKKKKKKKGVFCSYANIFEINDNNFIRFSNSPLQKIVSLSVFNVALDC